MSVRWIAAICLIPIRCLQPIADLSLIILSFTLRPGLMHIVRGGVKEFNSTYFEMFEKLRFQYFVLFFGFLVSKIVLFFA